MRRSPRLALENVDVMFGASAGLRQLSLTVRQGETVAVVGPSGAGKSSLLRAIAGLDPVGGGTILIDGEDRTSAPPEARGAVYLHQTPLLFPHLTITENVAFPLRVRGTPRSTVDRRVAEVLSDLGLSTLGSRAPATLSGGQRHRAALARAISARPPVLLLDEPLAALDPTLHEEALHVIRSAISDYDPATVLVTHDLSEAGALADQIAVLLDGRIRQLSTPSELFRNPNSAAVAGFVGFNNQIRGTLKSGRFFAPGWDLPLQTELRGPAVLLFRARSLVVDPEGELTGQIKSAIHTPAGLRLRVRISGADFEATSPGAEVLGGGEARFHLTYAEVRVFGDP